ncbi:hypothetical protein NDU88_004549 [Pleurodeles waltl]|uniref:Uncharacterized protein n=1 Tax=Pleurodeles waltl TaxID=8319 RepID=A0AAV7W8N7_PLEWA|nr:hypothetical protein NDU88_004549 [Pleurodeles waltl]
MVLDLNWSRVWDKTSGRTAGVRWVPERGKRAARSGALRRSTRLSRAVCGRTRPALRTPGSPPRANGQSRHARRGRGGDLLPPWQRRGPSGGSGSPSMQLRSAGPRGPQVEHGSYKCIFLRDYSGCEAAKAEGQAFKVIYTSVQQVEECFLLYPNRETPALVVSHSQDVRTS